MTAVIGGGRLPRAAAPTDVIVALPRSRTISIAARAAVGAFADRLGEPCAADACLLVSELVTNAYRHGRGHICLTIALHDHVARFAVHDDGDAVLRPSPEPDEHGGFGLNIVASIADHWGTGSGPTHVWFELHAPALAPSVLAAELSPADPGVAAAEACRARVRLCVLCGRPLRAGEHTRRVQGSTVHARCPNTSR